MTDVEEVTSTPTELLATGRRNLAVRDFHAATEALATACELLAKEHGDTADQCAEAYLWYGKALLGLSREESGVLGDGVPGDNADAEDEDDGEEQEENGENGENGQKQNGEAEAESTKMEADEGVKKSEAESTTKDDEPASSTADNDQPGPSNGEAPDESVADLENEDEVDNLQLAWETLDLARSILRKRLEAGGGDAARAQLADVHLALGEVALESETYDKAVLDMQSCLEIQKELYSSDDRRIAETHYQIGLANSLASSFEDAITHFKNAANILETRIKMLENPAAVKDDATVKKYSNADPFYSIEGEIKELKELLPEIQEKIQDMMDYKTERSPISEYLFLPWLGVTLRGLILRQIPTVSALIYTMAIVEDRNVNSVFITTACFLFLLEARMYVEIARVVRGRWERRLLKTPPDRSELKTLWSNEDDDVLSVEMRNFVY